MIKSFLLVQQLDYSLANSITSKDHTYAEGHTGLSLINEAHTSNEGHPADCQVFTCEGGDPSLVTIEIPPDDKEHRRGRSPSEKTALRKAAVVRDFETLRSERNLKAEEARSKVADKHHISPDYVRRILREHRKRVACIMDRYGKAMR